jgi:uncharacterized protein YtpQ (UPF0354 family)
MQPDGCIEVEVKDEENRYVCPQNFALQAQNTDLPDSEIDHFVAQVMSVDPDSTDIPRLTAVRPVLRATETLDAFDVQLGSAKHPTRLVREPFAADVSVGFVFDTPQGMRYATHADLADLGITLKELVAAAEKNLEAVTEETRWSRMGNVMIAEFDGNYESSLLTLDDLWPEIERELGGPIVAGVPARDSVVVTRADDAKSIAEVRRAMSYDFAYPISSKLFVRQNGSWSELR